jgi:hypothetical protein
MSGAPAWCFLTPMARVLSDLGACPGHQPDHWLWRQDSAAKIMRQPQLHNPRPPDDAKRLGCHRGIFHHRGSGYLSRLGGSEGNTTLLRAKGTKPSSFPQMHAGCEPLRIRAAHRRGNILQAAIQEAPEAPRRQSRPLAVAARGSDGLPPTHPRSAAWPLQKRAKKPRSSTRASQTPCIVNPTARVKDREQSHLLRTGPLDHHRASSR